MLWQLTRGQSIIILAGLDRNSRLLECINHVLWGAVGAAFEEERESIAIAPARNAMSCMFVFVTSRCFVYLWRGR